MALTPQPTLVEMTATVLDGVGEGGNDVAAPNTEAMVQSLIRRAQALIQDKAEWTISRVTGDFSLPAGATTFDWPDNTQPGNIHFIRAKRTLNPQYAWDLIAGITTLDRSMWLNIAALNAFSYSPSKYDYLNGLIEVGPACTEAVTLTVEYGLGVAVLRAPQDRPNCDGLAITLLAEIFFRNARGGDFRNAIPQLETALSDRLESQRPRQGPKQATVIGRRWNMEDPARRWDDRRQRHWLWRDVRP